MPFPTVEARQTGRTTASNTTTHAISLPAGIVAGELLFVVFSSDQSSLVSINTGVSGTNWNILGTAVNGSAVRGTILWKVAEGSDALTLTTGAGQQSSHISFRISNAGTPTGTSANGSGANSNPPNHAPAAGSDDYLWIATRSGDSTGVATSAPASFVNLQTIAAAGTGGASTNTAERELTAASLDPGTFTSIFEQWVSWTIAIPYVLPWDGPRVQTTAIREHGSANSTSHSITLPSGIVSGDKLVCIAGSSVNMTTASSGWTRVGQSSTGGSRVIAVFEKTATGSNALTISTASTRLAAITYRVGNGGTVEASFANGSPSNPNPPALTPSAGSAEYLWLTAAVGSGSIGVAPTDFTNRIATVTVDNPYLVTAEREFEGSTLDPGVFENSNTWATTTVAIAPVPLTEEAVGSSSGAATAAATGRATATTSGSTSGVATAAATGRATFPASASSTGVATAAATSRSIVGSAGSVAGSATAAATSVAVAGSAGASTATSTASSVGRAIWPFAAQSDGTATASGAGQEVGGASLAAGAASGVATVQAATNAIARASGTASGVATANGAARALAGGAGASTGIGAAAGVARAFSPFAGSSSGSATASGVTGATVPASGTATALATASAASRAVAQVAGSAAGVAVVAGTGGAFWPSVGQSAGSSSALADAQEVDGSSPAAGASAGSSTAQATTNAIARVIAASAGVATASGAAVAVAPSSAASAGTSSASSVGRAVWPTVASATGQATATAEGSEADNSVSATGAASGQATATAASQLVAQFSGSVQGAATAAATALAVAQSAGAASASTSAQASSATITPITGASSGVATAAAAGSALESSFGSAAGSTSVAAVGNVIHVTFGTVSVIAEAVGQSRSIAQAFGGSAGSVLVEATGRGIAVTVGGANGNAAGVAVGIDGTIIQSARRAAFPDDSMSSGALGAGQNEASPFGSKRWGSVDQTSNDGSFPNSQRSGTL